ncbi:hypothetical protein L7F22_040983 [Adiantum nelumboides]|nr:hypothetical protein [Adiantum nelumboides]MCO5587038.1 hypothetical protein [Adiantum nelumboides]
MQKGSRRRSSLKVSACAIGETSSHAQQNQAAHGMDIVAKQLFLEEYRERDGTLVRYCRVNENCSQRNRAWEKRVDLIHHVKKYHGLIIEVPRKSAGRPKGDQKSELPNGSRSHRQAKTRFQSLETRIKLARNKHIKYLNENAKKRWKLSSLNGKIPYEQWLKNYVHEEMEKWENDMPSRVAKMKANIAKGYKAMSRKYKSNDEKEKDPNEENIENTQHEDDTLTFSESMETHGEEDEETLHTPSSNEVVDKVSPTKKTLKSKTHIPIDISSPSGSICAIEMARSPNVHSYSKRYGLEVTYDVKLAREITNKKASSQAMNFFVVWIEHMFEEDTLKHVWFVDSLWLSFMKTLPSDRAMRNYFGRVDLSNRMFTFFPIVDEDRWTLGVFFNHRVRHLPRLPKNKSTLMFFDSMATRTIDQYMIPLRRALQFFSIYTTHQELKEELLSLGNCHIQTMEMLRQANTKDCGYYVMIVMKLLIQGGVHNRIPKEWLTSGWFSHAAVETLKLELGVWAQHSASDMKK